MVDCSAQSTDSDLDRLSELDHRPVESPGDGNDHSKVRLDESAACGFVARFNRLGEMDLVLFAEEGVASDVLQVPAELIVAVGWPLRVVVHVFAR